MPDGTPRPAMRHQPVDAPVRLAGDLAYIAETAAIWRLEPAAIDRLADALARGEGAGALASVGLAVPLAAVPPPSPAQPVRALALTVAQTCNLACGYCYAGGGSFGGADSRMDWPIAKAAIEALVGGTPPGGSIRIAFMGGEPMIARDLIRRAVLHSRTLCRARAITAGFSVTTNGTLISEEDAEFLAAHRFAVTVSLDGNRKVNDRLRPMRGGGGSFDRVLAGIAPLLARADRIALSARVTVTPENLQIRDTVDTLGQLGFASVGVSPLIAAAGGKGVLGPQDFPVLMAAMVECGEDWLAATLQGRVHPFANLGTALVELHRGKARSHGCGAARDYLAVDAAGNYAACHRFVNDPLGQMGSLQDGIDHERRNAWLIQRSVERQEDCRNCWARRLCGGGCHQEVLHAGRPACDHIRGWLDFALRSYGRMMAERPAWFDAAG